MTLHILSPSYLAHHDQDGQACGEIAVCSEMLMDEWQEGLVRELKALVPALAWHDVSLDNYGDLERIIRPGDTAWVLLDGIETDGYPGLTVIQYLENLQRSKGFRIIGPNSAFYGQDKLSQKMLFYEKRVNTPACFVLRDDDTAAKCLDVIFNGDGRKFILKPVNLYCSIGIARDSVVTNPADAFKKYRELKEKTSHILIEEFIEGREFSVLCMGNAHGFKSYEPVERVFHFDLPEQRFMDFEMTQLPHGDRTMLEHRLLGDSDLAGRVKDFAEKSFRAVGGISYARVDIRYDTGSGLLYVLEVNACPSVGLESTTEEILRLDGTPFSDFFADLNVYGTNEPAVHEDDYASLFPAGECVGLYRDPLKGRCLRVRDDIPRGGLIFKAEVDAFGVEEDCKRHYCHHCLRYSVVEYDILCPECGQVYYCSDECRALDASHRIECPPIKMFYSLFSTHVVPESITYYRTNIQALARFLGDAQGPLNILVTNYGNMGTAKQIEAWKVAQRLDRVFDGKIALSVILATITSTECNCFSADYDPDGVTLLSAKFAMLEHNCLPNALRRVDKKSVTVLALKDIQAGDPVSISYISALYHRDIRTQGLAEYYYFVCDCPLCRSEDDALQEEDRVLLRDYYRMDKEENALFERLKSSSCYSLLNDGVVVHEAVGR